MTLRRTGFTSQAATRSPAIFNGERAVVSLDDTAAITTKLTGGKAANLAKARQAGLPTLPGFVLTTAGATQLHSDQSQVKSSVVAALRDVWHRNNARTSSSAGALIVRSSSVIEDSRTTAQAGRFTSVLDVRGWPELLAAAEEVLASGEAAAANEGGNGRGPASMAVLIQPQLAMRLGGVLFTADPVSGKQQLRVSMVRGGPDQLVAGAVSGIELDLTAQGELIAASGELPAEYQPALGSQLAELAQRTTQLFGGPQDIEWGVDHEGTLWLLQSRPITTLPDQVQMGDHGRGNERTNLRGPVLGAGPVAETFPDPLSPLEEDLWVVPLRAGLTHALRIVGLASERQLRRSPVVTTVHGRVVADLELLGVRPKATKWKYLSWLNPLPAVRRLRSSWRVGRLRAAMPELTTGLLHHVDNMLSAVPSLSNLSDRDLLAVLRQGRNALQSLHGYEVLLGLLLDTENLQLTTGSQLAFAALKSGRARGLSDAQIIAEDPVVLALVPPRIGSTPALPGIPDGDSAAPSVGNGMPTVPATGPATARTEAAMLREALRIRIRWVQELTARAAIVLGGRLAERNLATDSSAVRAVTLDELAASVRSGVPLPSGTDQAASPSLPMAFRLTADGEPVSVESAVVAGSVLHGLAAGGGRGVGPVHIWSGGRISDERPPAGVVLVVRTLDPQLATWLSDLTGLVAETGSPLSHLAIMAREYDVPTVVGVANATSELSSGEIVAVDGGAGVVEREAAT